MKLMTVEAAREAMLVEVAPLGPVMVPLTAAMGRVLSSDVTAVRDQPPFTNSAMDGWAVKASPQAQSLQIIGESAAGHGFEGELSAGQAVRIFTGAALPAGADSVVIQEEATQKGDQLQVPASTVGDNIRKAGKDFRTGDTLLKAGTRIDTWRLSLAASAGRAEVAVGIKPRIAILSTGEEIVEAPATPSPFQIYDSGSPALAAMVEAWGGSATRRSGIRDRLDAVIAAMRQADCDLIVTLGGASVGDHDLVRTAALELGLRYCVESVAVRPGKPTFFGVLADGRRLLGLPGNPASAFVCAELFLRPLIARYSGSHAEPSMEQVPLAVPLAANGPREHWMRAHLGSDGTVTPYGDQDSSLVSVFAGADALLRRKSGAPAASAHERVDILRLVRG
jgi:molybdopterin molybdotransferase